MNMVAIRYLGHHDHAQSQRGPQNQYTVLTSAGAADTLKFFLVNPFILQQIYRQVMKKFLTKKGN